MVIKVDHHASVVIVESVKSGLLLLSGYDMTYPGIEFRGAVNPLGGNQKTGVDKSPRDILERELSEEINYPKEHQDKHQLDGYADRSDIRSLREGIDHNIRHYTDFLILDPIVERNKDKSEEARKAIVSCYSSKIPDELMDFTRRSLENGLKMNCEGVLNVVTPYGLIHGNSVIAWAAPIMLSYFLGTTLPNPRNAFAVPIGETKESLQDYLNEFSYIKPL